MIKKIIYYLLLIFFIILSGCSDNKNVSGNKDIADKAFEDNIDLTGINSNKKIEVENGSKIVMDSVALTQIAAELDLKLAGIPTTKVGKIPSIYNDIYQIGLPMNPNMEVLKTINPTMVYVPDSLEDWIDEGLKKHNIPHKYVNLRSVENLYNITNELAIEYKKEDKIKKINEDKISFFEKYNKNIENKKRPKVLILMGLPGSYVVATENSYVGNLVSLAGGENIVKSNKEFEQVNMEYLIAQKPDYILRTAHAMPEVVNKMFEDDFKNNKSWQHFKAVQENKIIDLDSTIFGMTAQFNYKEGLLYLEKIFYS